MLHNRILQRFPHCFLTMLEDFACTIFRIVQYNGKCLHISFQLGRKANKDDVYIQNAAISAKGMSALSSTTTSLPKDSSKGFSSKNAAIVILELSAAGGIRYTMILSLCSFC